MSLKLALLTIIGAIFFIALATYFLKKGRIPEKYALLWYAMALVLILVAIFPKVFSYIANKLGFSPMSAFLIAIFIVIILLFIMALTIMMAGQRKKTTMLIQEISILKKEIEDFNKSGKGE